LQWETPYADGLQNGVEKEYYESGELAGTATYKFGNLVGYKHCADGRVGNSSLDCVH